MVGFTCGPEGMPAHMLVFRLFWGTVVGVVLIFRICMSGVMVCLLGIFRVELLDDLIVRHVFYFSKIFHLAVLG